MHRPARRQEHTAEPVGEYDFLLDRQARAVLGNRLKAMYGDIAAQPVPEKLLKLLQRLEQEVHPTEEAGA